MGFKQIYGIPFMDFIYLITKWILLENYSTAVPYNVNEVGLKIGYNWKPLYSAFKRNLLQHKKIFNVHQSKYAVNKN
jgi:hypothetical protein